jgi:hypothetical protein
MDHLDQQARSFLGLRCCADGGHDGHAIGTGLDGCPGVTNDRKVRARTAGPQAAQT